MGRGQTARRRKRRASIAALACTLLAGTAAAAVAQDPPPDLSDPTGQGAAIDRAIQDPGPACQEQADDAGLSPTTGGLGCDTKYTPIAKDGKGLGWTQFAGAEHPDAANPDYDPDTTLSKVPPTVDFYTVSFANETRGFAGGAECRESGPGRNDGESYDAYMERIAPFLNTCERVPVIYRYTDFTANGPFWDRAYKGDTPGFVGAISWLRNTDTKDHGLRALAVGGTGSPNAGCPKSETDPPYPTEENPTCGGYPRREPAVPESSGCKEGAVQDPDVNPPPPLGQGTAPEVDVPSRKVRPGSVVVSKDPQEEIAKCEEQWREQHDPAGDGRAWLFTDGGWQDLGSAGDGLPRDMRGQTAVDSAPDLSTCAAATECAFTGGLQQIWMWKDDGFESLPWRPNGPSRQVVGPNQIKTERCGSTYRCEWRYRVRAIRVDAGLGGGAVALTSGCCSLDPDAGASGGRTLKFRRDEGSWSVSPGSSLCTLASTTYVESRPSNCVPQRLPDTYYALMGNEYGWSSLVSPGGPRRSNEPPSYITGTSTNNGLNQGATNPPAGPAQELARHFVATSARLVAGDGDFQGHQVALHERAGGDGSLTLGSPPGPEGLMDWAVGGFKGSDRAVAYTTTTNTYSPGGVDGPFPLTCPADFLNGQGDNPESAPKCQPDEKAAEQSKSRSLQALSSYFLNGFAFADPGTAWGVGDRGAIERLAGNGAAAGGTLRKENAPRLGDRRRAELPPRGPYDATSPSLAHEPGGVKPWAAEAWEKLPGGPRMTPYGSPNPISNRYGNERVKQLVMSRDGSEGWAIGDDTSSDSTTALHRFDGTRWRRCSTASVEGVIKADPACEALRPLRNFKTGVQLSAIARIPMEYGSDPTRADDFEAIAAAKQPDATGRQPILRYHDGKWDVDDAATRQLDLRLGRAGPISDIAFSGPDDGWLIVNATFSAHLYHYDGVKWLQCAQLGGSTLGVDQEGCLDRDGLLPAQDLGGPDSVHMTSAGDRLYFYANRRQSNDQPMYPIVLYKDPGPCSEPGDSGCWKRAYDPGCVRREQDAQGLMRCVGDDDPAMQGTLDSLSVALGPDGSYNGWGIGSFGVTGLSAGVAGGAGLVASNVRIEKGPKETPLIKSSPEGTEWGPARVGDAAMDYLLRPKSTHDAVPPKGLPPNNITALPGPDGRGRVFAQKGVTVWLDPKQGDPQHGTWGVLPAPYYQLGGSDDRQVKLHGMAPDNQGGLWLAVGSYFGANEDWFYRFSDYGRPDRFQEVAHPIREWLTAAAGGGDGSFWVATNTSALYRYDRQTGWDRMTVPGWDPGRFATNPSPAHAIAVGTDGEGVVVGKNGRIANIGRSGAVLDAAAGILCSNQTPPNQAPCGTGRDLLAAAVAPGGSALVGGKDRALLYREGGRGQFHAVPPPPAAVYATFTGISMPAPDRAWVVTDGGEIYRGSLSGSDWSWDREDADAFGESITRDERRVQRTLRSVAIDASGRGYAVGDHGTIIERTGGPGMAWKRVSTEYTDQLRSVTLGGSAEQALIAGDGGLVLTLSGGHFEPARFAHRYDPTNWGIWDQVSRAVGVALLPGSEPGDVEAWVATQVQKGPCTCRIPEPGVLLHHTNNPADPLLDGKGSRAAPLADAPLPSSESVSFAAFGNSSCQSGGGQTTVPSCHELTGSNETHDLIGARVRDELLHRTGQEGAPEFSLFTGDVGDVAGDTKVKTIRGPQDTSPIHDRWKELIADPLNLAGTPVFGAIGGHDLSPFSACEAGFSRACADTYPTRTGTNLGWRQAMAAMPAPWGSLGNDETRSDSGLSFQAVDTGGTKREAEDLTVEDPTKAAGGETAEDPTESLGGPQSRIRRRQPGVSRFPSPPPKPPGAAWLGTGPSRNEASSAIARCERGASSVNKGFPPAGRIPTTPSTSSATARRCCDWWFSTRR